MESVILAHCAILACLVVLFQVVNLQIPLFAVIAVMEFVILVHHAILACLVVLPQVVKLPEVVVFHAVDAIARLVVQIAVQPVVIYAVQVVVHLAILVAVILHVAILVAILVVVILHVAALAVAMCAVATLVAVTLAVAINVAVQTSARLKNQKAQLVKSLQNISPLKTQNQAVLKAKVAHQLYAVLPTC